MAATGALALVATTANPAGAAATKSPWLAHTRISAGTSMKGSAEGVVSDRGVTELALRGGRHGPAEVVRHQLHAVADAQHRTAKIEQSRVALRRAGVGHALRSARKNDPGRLLRANRVGRRVRRPDLRVHRELAQASSDQLGVLRPEIENDDGLMVHERGLLGLCPKGLER